MYLKGVGMTRFSIEDKSSVQLCTEAIQECLKDSEFTVKDIDACVVATEDSSLNGEKQRHYPALISALLGKRMPIIRVPAVCGGGGAAFWTANKLGFNNVLVLGVEKLATNTSKYITEEILNAAEKLWEQEAGVNFPGVNALVAQEHMGKYGTTTDDLALVALKNHENAFNNPKASFFKKRVTLENIKKSPVVASPLRLFDCSISVNGAAAAIISKDKTDIEIKGSGMATDYLAAFEREDLSTWRACNIASEIAYKQAGVEPRDIDFAEVHDAFTILEIMAYEDLGFAKKGKGAEMIREGITKLDGKLPVNPCGGLKAKGHPISATGIAQIYETAKQLRGEAEDRQVAKHRLALTQNTGGAGGTITTHIFRKI